MAMRYVGPTEIVDALLRSNGDIYLQGMNAGRVDLQVLEAKIQEAGGVSGRGPERLTVIRPHKMTEGMLVVMVGTRTGVLACSLSRVERMFERPACGQIPAEPCVELRLIHPQEHRDTMTLTPEQMETWGPSVQGHGEWDLMALDNQGLWTIGHEVICLCWADASSGVDPHSLLQSLGRTEEAKATQIPTSAEEPWSLWDPFGEGDYSGDPPAYVVARRGLGDVRHARMIHDTHPEI